MTIEEYYTNFDIEDFKKTTGTKMASLNVFFVNEWNKDKTYSLNDEVICYKNYIKQLYQSLINDNVNNDPLTSEDKWTFINTSNDILQRYITDNDIQAMVNVSFVIFISLCKGLYSVMTPLLIDFLNCLICLNIIDKATNNTGLFTTSESIDNMSIGGEASDVIKNYPLLNNPFGLRFLFLYNLLFGLNSQLYCCIKNDPYNY